MEFKCSRCGNSDPRKIGYKNGAPYCRNCITFPKAELLETNVVSNVSNIYLTYSLSPEQKTLSDKLVNNFLNHKNSFVYAVCGSGKTEIVLESIKVAISQGKKVGFVIPRRDVVIEIKERLENIFKDNSVVSVFGGHSKVLQADIVCLTSHQLYRYQNYFSLLVFDEIDAFPYKGNSVLNALYRASLSGNYIEMSATPTKEDLESYKKNGVDVLTLFKRYHGGLLPVPSVVIRNPFTKYITLIKYLKKYEKQRKPVLIFCPTIAICESTYRILFLLFRSINYVHSKRNKREEVISDFKQGKTLFLCTTAVLERGVTIKDLQAIIFNSDHPVYNQYSLVQIAGRVGRKIDAKEGDVIFICEESNIEIKEAVESITSANKSV